MSVNTNFRANAINEVKIRMNEFQEAIDKLPKQGVSQHEYRIQNYVRGILEKLGGVRFKEFAIGYVQKFPEKELKYLNNEMLGACKKVFEKLSENTFEDTIKAACAIYGVSEAYQIMQEEELERLKDKAACLEEEIEKREARKEDLSFIYYQSNSPKRGGP